MKLLKCRHCSKPFHLSITTWQWKLNNQKQNTLCLATLHFSTVIPEGKLNFIYSRQIKHFLKSSHHFTEFWSIISLGSIKLELYKFRNMGNYQILEAFLKNASVSVTKKILSSFIVSILSFKLLPFLLEKSIFTERHYKDSNCQYKLRYTHVPFQSKNTLQMSTYLIMQKAKRQSQLSSDQTET